MAQQWFIPGFGQLLDDDEDEYFVPGFGQLLGSVSAAVASTTGSIIYGNIYNMIHTIVEEPLRLSSSTELIIRKRDKKPIITGGDH